MDLMSVIDISHHFPQSHLEIDSEIVRYEDSKFSWKRQPCHMVMPSRFRPNDMCGSMFPLSCRAVISYLSILLSAELKSDGLPSGNQTWLD